MPYVDTTGCGNALNVGHPTALRMVMDSLRYWVTEMGVDGFRFDLAPTLAREDGAFDPFSAFFDLVAQDPVIARAKLIAEPWDVGRADSYAVGRFPPLWSEWNGRFRDSVRDWWRSQDGRLAEFASRVCASSDIYGDRSEGRRPSASVNFVTVHDGFTLNDLVSYDRKHNEANTEDNRDGTDDNRSWNCGAEGPTTDQDVLALRARQKRAFLLTLLLSGGVPLLLGGDELGRTQQGNNNAYCQDNEITWFDWSAVDDELLKFTSNLVALRRRHPVFRRRRFLTGPAAADLRWFTPSGADMTVQNWSDPSARSVALFVDGSTDPDVDASGTPLVDDDFLILVNAWWQPLSFSVPASLVLHRWDIVCDSFDPARTGIVELQLDRRPAVGSGHAIGALDVEDLRQPVPDLPLDTILLGLVEDLVPPAGVEAVVERAMAVVHVPGHERLNGSGLEADGVVGSGDSRSQIQRFRRSRRFLKRVRFPAAPPREDAPDGSRGHLQFRPVRPWIVRSTMQAGAAEPEEEPDNRRLDLRSRTSTNVKRHSAKHAVAEHDGVRQHGGHMNRDNGDQQVRQDRMCLAQNGEHVDIERRDRRQAQHAEHPYRRPARRHHRPPHERLC